MPSAKLVVGCGLAGLVLSACGSSAKPVAGTPAASGPKVGHAAVDDPRTRHLPCLRAHHLPVTEVGQTGLQIGPAPGGPSVTFVPTVGAAQSDQIANRNPGAEVIGAAVLFPNQAPEAELQVVEDCLAAGVPG